MRCTSSNEFPKNNLFGRRSQERKDHKRGGEGLVLSHWQWYKINETLFKEARESEKAEQYAAKEQNKKNLSRNMTKNWKNTLASINAQNEQKRLESIEKAKNDRIEDYNRIMKARTEERTLKLADARRALFETKDLTRQVANAMQTCAIVAERKKQIEYKNALIAAAEEKEKLYMEKIEKDVEEYKKEMERKRISEMQKKKDFKNGLDEQTSLINDNLKIENTKKEADHISKTNEVIEKTKKCKQFEKEEEMKRTRAGYEKGYHLMDLENKRELEEEEEEEVNRINRKYAAKFACERKRVEKEEIEKKILEREKIAENMKFDKNGQDEIYENAIHDLEEQERRKAKEKEEIRMKLNEEMKKWNEDYRRAKEEEKTREREARKWTMLQMYRKREVDREWREELKRRDRERKRITGENYAQQIREKEEMLAENLKLDQLPTSTQEKDSILKYCDEAVEYVKDRGWDDYPLLATIARIKKELSRGSDDGKQESAEENRELRSTNGLLGTACYCLRS